MNFSQWMQGHRRSILFLLVLLALAGALAAFKLPVTLFPNVDFPRVLVSLDAGDRPADLMMQRVKVGRPTARVNWTIHPSDRLNCAPVMKQRYAHEHEGITPENAGTRYDG